MKLKLLTMKKKLFIICVLSIVLQLRAQNLEYRAAQLLESQNYIELDKLYKSSKDELSPISQLRIEAVIGAKFNSYEKSSLAIEKLLNEYTEDLSEEEFSTYYSVLIANLMALGDYTQASTVLFSIAPEEADALKYIAMRESAPKTHVIVPQNDVVVPFSIIKVGKGEQLLVECEVNGKKDNYIYDTGCNEFNFVSAEYAKDRNLKIIFDSLSVSGALIVERYCKLAMCDEMRIGDIVIENPLFIVYDSLFLPDSITLHPVLGNTIQRELGEVQFDNIKNEMTVPKVHTVNPYYYSNLFYDGNYYLGVDINGSQGIMFIDTGNGKTNLNTAYYEANKAMVESKGVADSTMIGGFGHYDIFDIYRLPEVAISLIDGDIVLKDVAVEIATDNQMPYSIGSLGLDFLRSFDKFIINYDDMFVSGM